MTHAGSQAATEPGWTASNHTPARAQRPGAPLPPHRQADRAFAVAQVIGCFTGGGAERLALNLAAALAKMGVRSYAAAIRSTGLNDSAAPDRVELAQFGAVRGRTLPTLRAMVNFRSFVRDRGIRVVHVHGKGSLPFCAIAMLGLRPRPRLVFTWHSPEYVLESDRGLSRAALRWALRRCDHVYGPSSDIVQLLTRRIRLARPAEVFRNGVAPAPPASDNGTVPVVVWAARLVPTKDPQILLRAAATLHNEGHTFRLVIAGDSPVGMDWFAQGTRQLVDDLGLREITSMPGWIDDTAALFRSASIAVQSSRSEGLSLSLLEQMMSGLAIIATDVGDTAVAVRDRRTGLLIPAGDEAALTAALRSLLVDPGLRRRLGREAANFASAEFTLERMAEQAWTEYTALVRV